MKGPGAVPIVVCVWDGLTYPGIDCSLRSPKFLKAVPPLWQVPLSGLFATIESAHPVFEAISDEATTSSRGHSVRLSVWLNKNKQTLFLAGDRMIDGDRYLAPQHDLPPIDPSRLTAINWYGVNFRVESQTSQRKPESIQAFMSSYLRAEEQFDVLIDDDRSGEASDFVGLQVDRSELVVTLVHCKYSSAVIPGARLADLYEVCLV